MGYPKQVYDNAWQTINRRRDTAKREAAAHREEIHRCLPEVERLERKMAVTAAGITKAVITNPQRAEAEIERLSRESLVLQRERESLLTAAGYPPDYLKEKYHCTRCEDTGYVGVAMCSCLESLLKAEAHAWLSSISPADRSTFSAFHLSYYPETAMDGSNIVPRKRMGEILEYCRRYAEGFTMASENILLLGQTGLGKTHMSLAIAQTVTERGYGVLYASVQQLMDRLETERFAKSAGAGGEYRDNLQIVLSCDLLILDDMGTEFFTTFTSSSLYNIINTRMVEKRPVIVSTNLEPPEIEKKYGQRMASRLLCEFKVLKFFGKDIRFLRKMQG